MNLLILPVLLIPFLLTPAFGDTSDFMFTDKSQYYSDGIVTVFSKNIYAGNSYGINISDIDNNQYYSLSSHTNNDGSLLFIINDAIQTGNYELKVFGNGVSLETFFTYDAESESPFEVKTDKPEYYRSQEILVTAIPNTDQFKSQDIDFNFYYSNGTKMELVYPSMMQTDDSFDSMIYTDGTPWDNYTGYVIVNATVSEFWNTAVFYYTDEPDMTKETTYYRTMDNENRLNNNDKDMQNIRDEIVVLNGYLGGIANPTLDSEFPLVLNQNDARKVTAEIKRLEEAIIKTDTELNQTMTQLTDALADNNSAKIEKFTKSVGSYIALNELRKAALNMINIYIEIYS